MRWFRITNPSLLVANVRAKTVANAHDTLQNVPLKPLYCMRYTSSLSLLSPPKKSRLFYDRFIGWLVWLMFVVVFCSFCYFSFILMGFLFVPSRWMPCYTPVTCSFIFMKIARIWRVNRPIFPWLRFYILLKRYGFTRWREKKKMQTGSKKLNVSWWNFHRCIFFLVRKDSESANSKQKFQIRFFSALFFFFRLANAYTKQMSLTFSRLKHIKEKTSLFFFCCSRSFLLFSYLFAVDGSITSIHDRGWRCDDRIHHKLSHFVPCDVVHFKYIFNLWLIMNEKRKTSLLE